MGRQQAAALATELEAFGRAAREPRLKLAVEAAGRLEVAAAYAAGVLRACSRLQAGEAPSCLNAVRPRLAHASDLLFRVPASLSLPAASILGASPDLPSVDFVEQVTAHRASTAARPSPSTPEPDRSRARGEAERTRLIASTSNRNIASRPPYAGCACARARFPSPAWRSVASRGAQPVDQNLMVALEGFLGCGDESPTL